MTPRQVCSELSAAEEALLSSVVSVGVVLPGVIKAEESAVVQDNR